MNTTTRNTTNRIFLILLLLDISIVQSSCKKDWFNQKSDINLTVPSTIKDLEMLLDDFSTVSRNAPALGELAADGFNVSDEFWNTTLISSVIPIYTNQRNAYTWSNEFPYQIVSDWNSGYKKIFICNQVLEGLKTISNTDPDIKTQNQVKGNALFIRSKVMSDLSVLYAVIFPYNDEGKFGLPLKFGIDVTEKPSRATVSETYNYIIEGLKEAATLLPLRNIKTTRGSKTAAWAQLARIYQIIGKHDLALLYSDSVLLNYNNLIDFNSVLSNQTPLDFMNKEIIFYTEVTAIHCVFPIYSIVDEKLYNLYEPNDLRKSIYFSPSSIGFTYSGSYSQSPYAPFSGLATDEIYLIKAESQARLNRPQDAMNTLNSLLVTRYQKKPDGTTTYNNKTATTQNEALTIIFEERQKELVRRGIRWSDLRRLNEEENFKIRIERSIGGNTYILYPNSFQYTFPIPQDEISNNNNIVQNPGWK